MKTRDKNISPLKTKLSGEERDPHAEYYAIEEFTENNPKLKTAEIELLAYLWHGKSGVERGIKSLIEIFANSPGIYNIDSVDHNGNTAIIYATERWFSAEIVRALLQLKPNVNIRGERCNTALMNAVYFRHPDQLEIVEELIKYGANPNLRNANGNTSLHLAIFGQDPDIISCLIAAPEADLNMKNHQGNSPLLLAAMKHHAKAAKKLIAAKADLNSQNQEGNTALLYATGPHPFFSKYISLELIKAGADVNLKNKLGETALLVATKSQGITHNKIEIIKSLISHGAEINIQLPNGRTALMLATKHDSHNIIQELIKAGAALEIQDNAKLTALMLAAKRGSIRSVDALIHAKANLDTQDQYQRSALILAIVNNKTPYSWQRKNTEVAFSLIAAGANLDLQDHEQNTALILAIKHDQKEIALKLIQQGANLDLQNADGKTALIVAAEIGDEEIMTTLIMKGADIHKQTNAQETAVDYVVKRELFLPAKLLVGHGAKPRDTQAFLSLCAQHDTEALTVLKEAVDKIQSHYVSTHQQSVNEAAPSNKSYSGITKAGVFGDFANTKIAAKTKEHGVDSHSLRKSV